MAASSFESERLPCPSCQGSDIKVKESRELGGDVRRRHYQCADCGTGFNVRVETDLVWQKDGQKLVKTETMTKARQAPAFMPGSRARNAKRSLG